MVYTTALLFGHRLSGPADEHSVAHMIRKFSRVAAPGRASSSARRGSIDSGDWRDLSWRGSAGVAGLEETTLLHQDVTRLIECCLVEAKASTLHCQVLLLPRHMTARVGQDVVRSSADEPCGLKGASIKVFVDGKDGLKAVGNISPDQSVTPTFELSVVFKADREQGWLILKHIFDPTRVLKLKPEYTLVKRKLYSSASPVIHQFSSEPICGLQSTAFDV